MSLIHSTNMYWMYLCHVDAVAVTKMIRFHSTEKEMAFEERFGFLSQFCLWLVGKAGKIILYMNPNLYNEHDMMDISKSLSDS